MLDSNGAIFSFNTFINQGSGANVGCYGLGAWQLQSTNYSVTANTSHSATVTYFTGGTWTGLSSAYLRISVYTAAGAFVTGNTLSINPSTANGTGLTISWTPAPGVTYKVFGAIVTDSNYYPEPVCRVVPSPTPSITPSITPTSSPCVCVCGTTITNTAGYTINGSWTDCYEVVHGFSLGAYQAYALPCSGPEGSNIYVKYGSVTADGPFTVSYGSCTPPPTQTPTPSVTPSSTPPPAYAHCLEYSSVSCNDACTNYPIYGCYG